MVVAIDVNYSQIANNLPSSENVIPLVRSIAASKGELYNADLRVLKAFANNGVEFIVGLGNECLAKMRDLDKALAWVKTNVQACLPATKITYIAPTNVQGILDRLAFPYQCLSPTSLIQSKS
ncbi:hypothetical protein U1Q18_030055 [Sarracenia purpurea var. burkii]